MNEHQEFVADRLESKDRNTIAVVERLACYKPRYAFVLSTYYGLDRCKMTLKEIGEILNVSKTRVWQLRNKALQDLWNHLVNSVEFTIVPWVQPGVARRNKQKELNYGQDASYNVRK